MIKASPELLEALGVKAESDFSAALLGRLNSDAEKIAGLEKTISEMSGNITRIDSGAKSNTETIGALTSKVESIKIPSPAEVKAWAEDAGSLVAATALGKVGLNAIAPAPTAEDEAVKLSFKEIVAANMAAGQSKADAIRAAVKSNPKEYAEARASGNITF